MCLILSLTGCPKGGRPERRFFNREPQAVKKVAKYHECKKTTVIAVVDTGFGGDESWIGQEQAHLCKFGHKDFTEGKVAVEQFGTIDSVPVDDHGHGTHIAGLVDFYARQTNDSYCLVILKYYDPKADDKENLVRTVEAIEYARRIKADFINYSGGGIQRSAAEEEAIKAYIDSGGTFVAAAGNESSNIDIFHYYPAQEDDRIIVVGNGKDEKHKGYKSNYGTRVNRWEVGSNVKMYNHYMTGTSQSTAIATGKIVAEKNKTCK